MAGNNHLLPKTYEDYCKLQALQFYGYRHYGIHPHWDQDDILRINGQWITHTIPRAGHPLIFSTPRKTWKQKLYWFPKKQDEADLEAGENFSDVRTNNAAVRLRKAKDYFGEHPWFKFQKILGYGGLGMALHFKYNGTRDIAIKLSLSGWEADSIREEEKMTKKMQRAAHCIQVIDPATVDILNPRTYDPKPRLEDSSDEEISSGDESIDEARPPKRPRSEMTHEERAAKKARWDERKQNWQLKRSQRLHKRADFMFLEYVPGGNLANFINRLNNKQPERSTRIPNRVLWQLWLCLVRACVGMKYPPRKFHPNRPKASNSGNAQQDLLEVVPPLSKRWRAKNIVHFDIDPSNIFIGNIDNEDYEQHDRLEYEHNFVPRLKLADFGLAQDIKPHKRNEYYFWKRMNGKADFYTPEQFAPDWDKIPPKQHGAQVGLQEIAGNYGSHTNVYGIALVMWTIITQMRPPKPPQPQVPRGVTIPPGTHSIDYVLAKTTLNPHISYCPLLMDGGYDYIDIDLRRTIYECMYHNPTHRPTVEDLLRQAQHGVQRTYFGESDTTIETFVSQYLLNADTE
ncbi:kinase-like protein [Hypoxylon sp. FL1857]|nr:kinase-like protein [Hypoxylon sp. FL1857]